MIIYDGIYEWDGKNRDGEMPVCWWPGSYRIRVVNLESESHDVFYIKSKAVIFRNQGKGTSIRNCIQTFAKKISVRFDLDIPKVLWVEVDSHVSSEVNVANITYVTALGGKSLLAVTWRPARPNELAILEPFFQGLDQPPPDSKAPA
ncbi:MAG: hypothetical protein V1793_18090 [Pseudomonadota bacterium]